VKTALHIDEGNIRYEPGIPQENDKIQTVTLTRNDHLYMGN
jgi:hypothetical protein